MQEKQLILNQISIDQLKKEITDSIIKQIKETFKNQSQDSEKIEPELQLLNMKQVSKLYGVSLPTLHKWNQTGRVKAYKIGTRVRYKKSEIEQALYTF